MQVDDPSNNSSPDSLIPMKFCTDSSHPLYNPPFSPETLPPQFPTLGHSSLVPYSHQSCFSISLRLPFCTSLTNSSIFQSSYVNFHLLLWLHLMAIPSQWRDRSLLLKMCSADQQLQHPGSLLERQPQTPPQNQPMESEF